LPEFTQAIEPPIRYVFVGGARVKVPESCTLIHADSGRNVGIGTP